MTDDAPADDAPDDAVPEDGSAPDGTPPGDASADAGLPPYAVMALAIAAALAIVALGFNLGADTRKESAPTPGTADAGPPARGEDAIYDLTTALPEGAVALAGSFAPGPEGAVAAVDADRPGDPLLELPLDGAPWATVVVSGRAVDGWSVLFGVADATNYWVVTVNPGAGTVEQARVVAGQRTNEVTYPVEGEVVGEVRIVVRDRLVQVEASGVSMPTASIGSAGQMTFGLLGRDAAAEPGAATWRSMYVQADGPLGAPRLPPLLRARQVDAADARTQLSEE